MDDNLRLVLVAFTAALPGCIAAWSSVHNGVTLKKSLGDFSAKKLEKELKKVPPDEDWYRAPELWSDQK